MKSLRELYRIGLGPSSSHTMGPANAAEIFKSKNPHAARYVVTLYGSLAATAVGHLSDVAVSGVFAPKDCEVRMVKDEELPLHPNGMYFEACDEDGKVSGHWTVYSVGGGELMDEHGHTESPKIYPFSTMAELLQKCDHDGKVIWNYVEEYEGNDVWEYLSRVLETMDEAVKHGLLHEGSLPGGLHLPRKAASYFAKASQGRGLFMHKMGLLFAYALAVSEENAGGGIIVTAPTCGSAGVVPAVLTYFRKQLKSSNEQLLRALATAGMIGNFVKENASISGAEVGCQGEVGTACAMAAGAAAQLLGGTPHQVEYAAEMGLEHHLGLTCDPVMGLVQVPCIERNAIAAVRALECASYVLLSDGRHLVSFDEVCLTMGQTGRDMNRSYRETSQGGLAYFHGKLKQKQ